MLIYDTERKKVQKKSSLSSASRNGFLHQNINRPGLSTCRENVFLNFTGKTIQFCNQHNPYIADSSTVLNDFHSESEDDPYFSVSTNDYPDRTRHVTNLSDYQLAAPKERSELAHDAKEIHDVLKGRQKGCVTVVCSVFEITVEGSVRYLHVLTTNCAYIPENIKLAASSRGYALLKAGREHAEIQMLLYAGKHSHDARLTDYGCDKPNCPQCRKILEEVAPDLPIIGEREDFSRKYYLDPVKKRSQGTRSHGMMERIQDLAGENYDPDGELLPPPEAITIIGLTSHPHDEHCMVVAEIKGGRRKCYPYKFFRSHYTTKLLDYYQSQVLATL